MRLHEQPRYKTPALREFRRLSGKTQSEVAAEADVSAGFIAALESGRMEARTPHLEADRPGGLRRARGPDKEDMRWSMQHLRNCPTRGLPSARQAMGHAST